MSHQLRGVEDQVKPMTKVEKMSLMVKALVVMLSIFFVLEVVFVVYAVRYACKH